MYSDQCSDRRNVLGPFRMYLPRSCSIPPSDYRRSSESKQQNRFNACLDNTDLQLIIHIPIILYHAAGQGTGGPDSVNSIKEVAGEVRWWDLREAPRKMRELGKAEFQGSCLRPDNRREEI